MAVIYLLDSSGNRLIDEEGNYLYVTGSLTFPVAVDETLTAADAVSAALRMGRAGRIGGVRRPVLGDARPMQLGGHRPPQRI